MAQLFRFKDMKAKAGLPVFQSVNSATAIRSTLSALKSGTLSTIDAADYSLFQVGEEDPETLRISEMDPKHVIDVIELVNEVENG